MVLGSSPGSVQDMIKEECVRYHRTLRDYMVWNAWACPYLLVQLSVMRLYGLLQFLAAGAPSLFVVDWAIRQIDAGTFRELKISIGCIQSSHIEVWQRLRFIHY